MSHKDAQAADSEARSFSGHVKSSLPPLGQRAQDEIRRAIGWPVRDATFINSYRQPSDYSPPLPMRGSNYTTTQYQATFNGPPLMNDYAQAPSHNHHILNQGVIQHKTKSGIIGYSTQPTYGEGSTVNNYVQATHIGYPDHENVQHEIESSGGWSTHNHSFSYLGHDFIGCIPALAALASSQIDTIPGLIQPTYCEGSTVNSYVLPHFPHRGIDQQDVGSIVAGRHTHNHPSTYSHQSLTTHSFTNSASENPQNVAVLFFSRATHDGGSTMNTYRQAPHDDRRDVGLLGDALEWDCTSDRANIQCDIRSATGWSSDSVPFTTTHHASPRYSSAYPVPGNPQTNTIPDSTQYQATYPTIDYDPVYSIDDRGSEYRVGVRVAACEWNDGNGPCGKNIIMHWNSIRKHVSSCHLDSRLPASHPTQCRWKGCQLTQCIRRDTTARHVSEMHFGIKRP